MEEVKKQEVESLFVPYREALALRELGFDEPCLSYYFSDGTFNDASEEDDTLYPGDPRFHSDTNSSLSEYLEDELKYNGIAAPLYQQAFRWFREKHGLSSWIYNSDTNKYFYTILQNGRIVKATESLITYEEAELACLRKLIEIVKDA
jgi:hypothetical protein